MGQGHSAKTYFKHDHAKGINIGGLSIASKRNAFVRCAENLWCYPPNVELDRLGASLVAKDNFKAVVRDASVSVSIHQDIML